MNDALALEYQRDYGSAGGDLNIADLVNNPGANGVCRVLRLGFPEAHVPARLHDGLRPQEEEEVRHPGSERFHAILAELAEMHDRKQADYGSDADPFANVRASTEWGLPAWVGAMVRLNDKVRRLQSLSRKGYLMNEAAEDSMRDIAVYAIIALVLLEEKSAIGATGTAEEPHEQRHDQEQRQPKYAEFVD